MAKQYQNRSGGGSRDKPDPILNTEGTPNLGLLYYKATYRELAAPLRFDQANRELAACLSSQSLDSHDSGSLDIAVHFTAGAPDGAYFFHSFELTTNYPGLAIGLGYSHSTGRSDEEFKLGFFFDHTTGLPVIPGPSIKGRLRSFFPGRYANSQRQKEVAAHLLAILSQLKKRGIIQSEATEDSLPALEAAIFEGEGLKDMGPLIQDTFFDAYPSRSANRSSYFIDTGAITPHSHPLKEPNPLRILKILPGVAFRFQFRLNNYGGLMAEEKKALFQYLLLEYGMGAKTATGFGQFSNEQQLEALRGQVAGNDGYLSNLPPLPRQEGKGTPVQASSDTSAPPDKLEEEKLGPDEVIAVLIGKDPNVMGKKLFRIESQEGEAEQVVSIRYHADRKNGSKAILRLNYDRKRKNIMSAILRKWLD